MVDKLVISLPHTTVHSRITYCTYMGGVLIAITRGDLESTFTLICY